MMLNFLRFSVVFSGLLLFACSSPESEWQKAQQDGSEEALLGYIQQYPDSPQAAEARRIIVEMSVAADWKLAETEASPDAYERFLEKHPDSLFAGVAESRAAELRARSAWQSVRDAADVAALERFVDEFPESPEAGLARARIAELAAPAADVAPAPAPVARQAPAPAPAAAPATGAGTHRAQLGAFGAAAAAASGRDALGRRYSGALAGAALEVQAADGMHRVVTVPLAERRAREVCAAVKAAGGECFVRSR